jgi:hypothetical protein
MNAPLQTTAMLDIVKFAEKNLFIYAGIFEIMERRSFAVFNCCMVNCNSFDYTLFPEALKRF